MLGSEQPRVCSSWLASGARGSLSAMLPPFRSSCGQGGRRLIAPRGSCAGVEERFQAAPPRPSARMVIPSHFLPQEDVSKAEEMFLNKTGEP